MLLLVVHEFPLLLNRGSASSRARSDFSSVVVCGPLAVAIFFLGGPKGCRGKSSSGCPRTFWDRLWMPKGILEGYEQRLWMPKGIAERCEERLWMPKGIAKRCEERLWMPKGIRNAVKSGCGCQKASRRAGYIGVEVRAGPTCEARRAG